MKTIARRINLVQHIERFSMVQMSPELSERLVDVLLGRQGLAGAKWNINITMYAAEHSRAGVVAVGRPPWFSDIINASLLGTSVHAGIHSKENAECSVWNNDIYVRDANMSFKLLDNANEIDCKRNTNSSKRTEWEMTKEFGLMTIIVKGNGGATD